MRLERIWIRRLAGIALAGALASGAAAGEALAVGTRLPAIEGKTFSGVQVSLPDAVKGKVALLVVTFSKDASPNAKAWTERFETEYGKNDKYAVYDVLMLEGLPRLMRGMISGQIKKDFPPARQQRALPVYKDEAAWKERLEVKDARVPHLVLLDGAGAIRWLHRGPFRDDVFRAMAAVAAGL